MGHAPRWAGEAAPLSPPPGTSPENAMRRKVDHIQRTELILQNAQELFGELGYPQVTLMLLAERCQLSRTVLYRYYESKRKVFEAVLYRISTHLGMEFLQYAQQNPQTPPSQKMRFILVRLVEYMEKNIPFLDAVVEYLIDLQRKGESVTRRVMRHTVLLRLTLFRLIREAVDTGEFNALPISQIAGVFYEQVMGAAMQMAVTETHDPDNFRTRLDLTPKALKK